MPYENTRAFSFLKKDCYLLEKSGLAIGQKILAYIEGVLPLDWKVWPTYKEPSCYWTENLCFLPPQKMKKEHKRHKTSGLDHNRAQYNGGKNQGNEHTLHQEKKSNQLNIQFLYFFLICTYCTMYIQYKAYNFTTAPYIKPWCH